jgi:hypothetical protein
VYFLLVDRMRYNEVVERLEEDDLNEMLRKLRKKNIIYYTKKFQNMITCYEGRTTRNITNCTTTNPTWWKRCCLTLKELTKMLIVKNEFTSLIDIIDCSSTGLSVRSRQARVWSKSQFPLTISRSTIRSFWWLSINNKG